MIKQSLNNHLCFGFCCLFQVQIQLTAAGGHPLVVDVQEMRGVDRLWLRLVAERDERVYGGGEQFSYFNLRGRSFPLWTREQGFVCFIA